MFSASVGMSLPFLEACSGGAYAPRSLQCALQQWYIRPVCTWVKERRLRLHSTKSESESAGGRISLRLDAASKKGHTLNSEKIGSAGIRDQRRGPVRLFWRAGFSEQEEMLTKLFCRAIAYN